MLADAMHVQSKANLRQQPSEKQELRPSTVTCWQVDGSVFDNMAGQTDN